MNVLKRGMNQGAFIDNIGSCVIEKIDKHTVEVIVPLDNLKGFIRANQEMKAHYIFEKGKLEHISITI